MRKKRLGRASALAIAASTLLLAFQNCAPLSFGSGGSNSLSSNVDSGGQAYDGKIYVLAGVCADGTSVAARIELKAGGGGTIVRENCENVPPRDIPASEIALSPLKDQLTYRDQTFAAEIAVVPPANLKAAYFQWSNPFLNVAPLVYFVDGIGYTASEIQALKSRGHTIVCVITAGVASNRNSDFGQFTSADLGSLQAGSSTDYWLDTRSANVCAIMIRRLDSVRVKGCDGITWDQTDAHVNPSGFPLDAQTGMDYAKFLAYAAKDRKMFAVLSHTGDLSASLADVFDMQFGHGCFAKGTCGRYQAFADRGKPVFIAENSAYSQALCDQAKASKYSLWFTTPTQDGSRYEPCQ